MKSMKKTKTMKRLALDALCAALIAVMMCSPVFAAAGTGLPEGFETDDNKLMAYHTPQDANYGYDFMGYVDGAWRLITYKTSTSQYGFKAGVYHKENTQESAVLGVTTATPEFIEDGKAIQMKYTVTNNTQATVSDYRFYIAVDTKVADNDISTNTVKDNTVIMTDPSTNISFFALSKTDGCTFVPTYYGPHNDQSYPAGSNYCYYIDVRKNNADPSNVTSANVTRPSVVGEDSALVMYSTKDTLAKGESKTYTIVIGMGKASEIDDIIDDITGDDTTPAEKSPATDDNSNLALWLALLFVSGGAVAGGAVAKKRSLNR